MVAKLISRQRFILGLPVLAALLLSACADSGPADRDGVMAGSASSEKVNVEVSDIALPTTTTTEPTTTTVEPTTTTFEHTSTSNPVTEDSAAEVQKVVTEYLPCTPGVLGTELPTSFSAASFDCNDEAGRVLVRALEWNDGVLGSQTALNRALDPANGPCLLMIATPDWSFMMFTEAAALGSGVIEEILRRFGGLPLETCGSPTAGPSVTDLASGWIEAGLCEPSAVFTDPLAMALSRLGDARPVALGGFYCRTDGGRVLAMRFDTASDAQAWADTSNSPSSECRSVGRTDRWVITQPWGVDNAVPAATFQAFVESVGGEIVNTCDNP